MTALDDLAQDLLGMCGLALLVLDLRRPDQQVLGAVCAEHRSIAAFGLSKDCLGVAAATGAGNLLFDLLRAGVVSATPQDHCQVVRRMLVAALDGASIGLLGFSGLFRSPPKGIRA